VERYDGPFGGTSAAAPYVAGVAALIEGATSADQSPAMLTRRLQANSTDINTPGTDNVSGAGLLNASATVTISQNSSTGRNSTTAVYEPNSTPAAYDGDDDGQISISELAVAGQAYVRGELTIAELATVGRAYINSTG
jgi:serine protease